MYCVVGRTEFLGRRVKGQALSPNPTLQVQAYLSSSLHVNVKHSVLAGCADLSHSRKAGAVPATSTAAAEAAAAATPQHQPSTSTQANCTP
jgi:hypothetical protein